MRITTLICGCGLALFSLEALIAFDAVAQTSPPVARDTPPGSALIVEMTPSSDPIAAAEKDPAERSARAIKCAQRADTQGLQGKIRKHFLHKCKSGA
jgi:hypothetical protein